MIRKAIFREVEVGCGYLVAVYGILRRNYKMYVATFPVIAKSTP